MIIRLVTRCGCERYLDVSWIDPREFVEVVIFPDISRSYALSHPELEIQALKRRFEYYGMHNERIPLYREVL